MQTFLRHATAALLCLTCSVHTFAETATSSRRQRSATEQESADKAFCSVRHDQVWFVSTRDIACGDDKQACLNAYDVRRYAGDEWIESSIDEFLAGDDPSMPTVVYVHGNRVEWDEAFYDGWDAYHAVYDCSTAPPVRFVIWSWPSSQVKGLLRDFRVKAVRADYEARLLGDFVAMIDPQVPLGLLGFSYGARVALGASHMLGGGEHGRSQLYNEHHSARDGQRQLHVVLTAPAVDNTWLLPGGLHDAALAEIDRMVLLYNTCDPVLKRYRFVEAYYNPTALGYTGFVGVQQLAPYEDRLVEYNVCRVVGKTHEESAYLSSDWTMQRARAGLFAE